MFTSKIATGNDWKIIKKLRLSALLKASRLYQNPIESSFTEDSQWQEHVNEQTKNGNIIMILYSDDKAIGMGGGKPNPYKEDAFIMHSLWVEPHMRCKGAAKFLIAAQEDFARAQGYNSIQACTNINNQTARDMYRSRGYNEKLSPSEFRPVQSTTEALYVMLLKTATQ